MISIVPEVKERLGSMVLIWEEKTPRRVYIGLAAKDIKEACKALFRDLKLRFITATATEIPQGMEILYQFSHDPSGVVFSLRVQLPGKDKFSVDSITPLFPAAEWIEREMWELLGIDFIGHPNLTHLLLIDDWPEGDFPLRHKK
jgi:NADH-quinone oxidoreductase subunit C